MLVYKFASVYIYSVEIRKQCLLFVIDIAVKGFYYSYLSVNRDRSKTYLFCVQICLLWCLFYAASCSPVGKGMNFKVAFV